MPAPDRPVVPGGRGSPDQIGFVTDDLERTVDIMAGVTGIRPWSLRNYHPGVLRHQSYRGAQAQFASRNAVAPDGSIGIVQPLQGPSVHLEVLQRRGVGPAYITWFVDDVDAAAAPLLAGGVVEAMRGGGHGLDGDGEFLYLDTFDALGVFTQFAAAPRRRSDPEGYLLDEHEVPVHRVRTPRAG